MSQILRGKRVSDVVEFLYATTALFLLTQGPVYTLWKPSADYLQFSPDPPVSMAYFATFALAQLPGVLLLARRLPTDLFRLLPFRLLVALLMWLGITSALSTFARHSVPEFLALVLTTCFGLYLAVTFSVRAVLWQLVIAMGTGSWLSYLTVVRLWEGARNIDEGYWIGIYFNRNSLAPVAAIGMLAAVSLVRWSKFQVLGGVLTNGGMLLLATGFGFVLFRSESATSVGALTVVLAVVSLVSLILFGPVTRMRNWHAGGVVTAIISLFAVAIGVLLREGSDALASLGRSDTFSARTPLWSLNWSGFLMRPWLGWGWQAAWRVPNFRLQGKWWTVWWENSWSHSGYFDMLLGGGVPAGLLFVLWVVFSLLKFQRGGRDSVVATRSSRTTVAVVVFVLIAATQESFFIGSHFLWALLVWGLTAITSSSAVSSRAESQPTSAANDVPAASPR
jgi:O-antigen ligase